MVATVFILLAAATTYPQLQNLPPLDRREHIDELLDAIEYGAGVKWLEHRDSEVDDHGRQPGRDHDDLPAV